MKGLGIALLMSFILALSLSWAQGAQREEIEKGKRVFTNNCQICHGANGKGDGPASASFNPRPANFTAPAFWQRKDMDKLITSTVENGHGMMPPISLKPDELSAVIDYITSAFKPGK